MSFNERFLLSSPNILCDLASDFEHVADCLRVIDVKTDNDGRVLRVLQNADLDEAIAYLASPRERSESAETPPREAFQQPQESGANFWGWRLRMAERIASELPARRFGVVAFYVFGSTKNATAGPGSDIDLLIHVRCDEAQRKALLTWLDGWSRCLAEVNFLRTGYRTDQLLDIHLVTDEDIASRTSFAVKIGAVTDAARPLPIKNPVG